MLFAAILSALMLFAEILSAVIALVAILFSVTISPVRVKVPSDWSKKILKPEASPKNTSPSAFNKLPLPEVEVPLIVGTLAPGAATLNSDPVRDRLVPSNLKLFAAGSPT